MYAARVGGNAWGGDCRITDQTDFLVVNVGWNLGAPRRPHTLRNPVAEKTSPSAPLLCPTITVSETSPSHFEVPMRMFVYASSYERE